MTTLRHCSLDPHYIVHYPGPRDQAQGHGDSALRPGDPADGGHQHEVSLGLRLRPGAIRGKYLDVEWKRRKCILISAGGLDV